MNPKTKKIVGNVVFVLVIGLLIWPTSRSYFQQALMKIGFFKLKLEVTPDAKKSFATSPKLGTEVSFINQQGIPVKVADLRGKVIFINFWATWCAPCRAEMPSINKLYNTYKDSAHVVFLIVEVEGDRAKAEAFIKAEGLNLPLSFPNSDIPKEWLSGPIPTTLILDKEGNLAARHEGLADYSTPEVTKFIQDLINK